MPETKLEPLHRVLYIDLNRLTYKVSERPDLFEPGLEVIPYESADECAEKVQYYLENENERKSIALAGQKRTLNEHTYHHRMEELIRIVQRFI